MRKASLTTNDTLLWYCPGCECAHGVPVVGGHAWGWNQSLTNPTLTPSVLVHAHETSPPSKSQLRCHCFVKDGAIQFLPDCGHALAGKTVDMEEWK